MSGNLEFLPAGGREFSEFVAMRDGVLLATDIYLPAKPQPAAVIVERTPYDRRGLSGSEVSTTRTMPLSRVEIARWFCERGYAVVMQDVRGRYGSEGQFSKYVNEAEDGVDTYAWILAQDWCDGRICSIGLSYGGHTQLAAACAGAPGLAAMFLDTGGLLNAFEHSVRCGGAFEIKQLTWAHRHAIRHARDIGDDEAVRALEAVDLKQALQNGTWRRGASPLAAVPVYENYLLDLWEKEAPDESWLGPATCAERWMHGFPDIPVFLLGSWNDPYARSMTELYRLLDGQIGTRPKLVMGPWLHGRRSQRNAGEADFGDAATLDRLAGCDVLELRHRWFEFALNGGADPWPEPVTYFEMGGNEPPDSRFLLALGGRWRSAQSWPPGKTATETFYPSPREALSAFRPAAGIRFEMAFDPREPFPTIGGAVTSGEPLMAGGMFRQEPRTSAASVFSRPDTRVFTTSPFERDFALVGTPVLRCLATCDAADFDLAAFLFASDGPLDDATSIIHNITDGIRRARYRQGETAPRQLAPGENARMQVVMMTTAFRLVAGQRLVLLLTGANFPRFDVNTGTGRPQPLEMGPWPDRISVEISGLELELPILQETVPDCGN